MKTSDVVYSNKMLKIVSQLAFMSGCRYNRINFVKINMVIHF